MTRRALFVYYSLTNQTVRAVDEMARAFGEQGWETRLCRVDLAPPAGVEFPLEPFWKKVGQLVPSTVLARPESVRFDESVLDERYDLVCIGSPTWSNSPALPITSFLQTPAARSLLDGGVPFAVAVVCRSLWRRNLRVVRRLATKAGGRFVAAGHFTFDGNQLQSTGSFFSYHRSGGKERDRYLGIRITPYGLSQPTMGRVASFAHELAARP